MTGQQWHLETALTPEQAGERLSFCRGYELNCREHRVEWKNKEHTSFNLICYKGRFGTKVDGVIARTDHGSKVVISVPSFKPIFYCIFAVWLVIICSFTFAAAPTFSVREIIFMVIFAILSSFCFASIVAWAWSNEHRKLKVGLLNVLSAQEL